MCNHVALFHTPREAMLLERLAALEKRVAALEHPDPDVRAWEEKKRGYVEVPTSAN